MKPKTIRGGVGRVTAVGLVLLLPACYEYLGAPPLLREPALSGASVKAPSLTAAAAPGSLHPDLSEVLRLLVDRNPELASLRHAAAAASRASEQADRAPNPALVLQPRLSTEGPTGLEGGATVSQKIEFGKRGPRVRESVAVHGVSAALFLARRAELAGEATERFLEILKWQEERGLDREDVTLLEALRDLTKHLVAEGAASRDKLLNAEVAVGKASLHLRDTERDFEAAKRRLETLLDLPAGVLGEVKGSLRSDIPFASAAPFRSLLESGNPRVRVAERRIELARRGVERERAKPIPDLTASASASYLKSRPKMDQGPGAWVGLGLAFPLPLLDANRAAIAAARHRVQEAEAARKAALKSAADAMERALASWEKADADHETWKTDLLPKLVEAAALAKASFEAGKLPYLDVLEANRELIKAKHVLLELRLARETARARVTALLGGAPE
ncbi:MAG: TolC family protein [Planctomycetota bacterium]|jgi:cobalt-zinc-cadmium efflux system outer membrane protein